MKKTCLIIACFLSLHCYAGFTKHLENHDNRESTVTTNTPSEISIGTITYQQNIVKLNLTSVLFHNISLQYERILTPKLSVAMGLRIMPKSNLPFRSTVAEVWDNEATSIFFKGTEVGGLAITPEFRYYLGSGNGKGFYMAPFLRYEHSNLHVDYELGNDISLKTTIPLIGKINTLGVGIMLGSQFNLGQHITLDWWILGPYYTSNKLNLEANNLNLNDDQTQAIQYDLDSIDFAWLKLDTKVTNTQVEASAKGSFGAIRSVGLCLGYKF